MLYVWCLAMASILGKPGGPGQFPTHDLSTVRGALQTGGSYGKPHRTTKILRHALRRGLSFKGRDTGPLIEKLWFRNGYVCWDKPGEGRISRGQRHLPARTRADNLATATSPSPRGIFTEHRLPSLA